MSSDSHQLRAGDLTAGCRSARPGGQKRRPVRPTAAGPTRTAAATAARLARRPPAADRHRTGS